jgi:MHS family proline/betaine transporter-like MFS transporter
MSLACNLAAAIFGGTSPIVVTKMITATGSHLPISYYIIAAAIVSFICLVFARSRRLKGQMYLV